MDPITTAIVAALGAGVASGATKVGEQVVADAYAKLKQLLEKKFGTRSKVIKAVRELEANPKSEGYKLVVKEVVASSKADKDADLLKAAQAMLKVIKAKPGGEQIIQIATGNENIQIAGHGNVISAGMPKNKK
jgi:hypothetical protein